MQYSSNERIIASLLSRFPVAKRHVKKAYQIISYIFYKKKYSIKCSYKITKVYNKNETFFGYYDKSPLNIAQTHILLHSFSHSTQSLPTTKHAIDVILFNTENSSATVIDQSYAYNWQQGSKLMWLNSDKFIYNNYDESKSVYYSSIYSISTRSHSRINSPIYDCYQDRYALSLSFERLSFLRPDYGYRNIDTACIDWDDIDNDGIFYIDLRLNTKKLLLSLATIINLHRKDDMMGAKHKFNHISISPDGQYFMFLHRWYVGNRKYDSLIVSNIEGDKIRCLSDDGMVSHCCWYGNDKIFGYLRDSELGDQYYMLDILSGNKECIGSGRIDCFGDGHPHIYGDSVVFDTYPNKSRMKELYTYNIADNSINKIGEFLESFDYSGETRCDLHPRFSLDGKKIFIDSVHEGSRALYMIDLEVTDE